MKYRKQDKSKTKTKGYHYMIYYIYTMINDTPKFISKNNNNPKLATKNKQFRLDICFDKFTLKLINH